MYSKALVFVSCEAGVPCSVWEVPYLVCLSDVMLTNDSAESQLVPCIRLQRNCFVSYCVVVYMIALPRSVTMLLLSFSSMLLLLLLFR